MFYSNDINSENLSSERLRLGLYRIFATDSTYIVDTTAPYNIIIDSTTYSAIKMPDATTLSIGHGYYIVNETSNLIRFLGGDDATTGNILFPNTRTNVVLRDNTTSGGFWIFESSPRTSFGGSFSFYGAYNANAATGRYLEIYPNLDSSIAPYLVVSSQAIIAISVGATALATGTIGVFKTSDLVNPITSITLTNQDSRTITNLYIPVLEGDELALRVTSGSFTKPYVTVYLSTT